MNNSKDHQNEIPGQNKEYEIVVNAEQKIVLDKKISFVQVVELAFGPVSTGGNTIYTVTYKRGEDKKPEGSMVNGDVINIKSGMVFNVTTTDKS